MPATHTTSFTVRHYECDAYGHLNHANYLRYMEEAAFGASAAVGYPKERYESMGYLWLARETEIEYLKPMFYQDTVEIRTWVEDFRRVRSIRRYELYNGGELAARASTDWVYIHRDTGRPSAVPAEMVTAFAGDTPLKEISGGTRESFPPTPPLPAQVFTLRRRVEWRDLDTAQHVNNAVYLHYAEDCGMQAGAAYGWPTKRIQEAGWGIFARKERIEYRLPALLDDEIEIQTWAYDLKRISAVRYYAIKRGDDLLAQIHSTMVCADLATGRPMRVPEDFLADAHPNIAAMPSSGYAHPS